MITKNFLLSLIIIGVICLSLAGTTYSTYTDTENSQNIIKAGTIDISAGTDLENLQNPFDTTITKDIHNKETMNTTIMNTGTSKADIYQTIQTQKTHDTEVKYNLKITKYEGTHQINQITIEKDLKQNISKEIFLETLEPNQHITINNEFTITTENTNNPAIKLDLIYIAKQTDTETTNKFYDNYNKLTINLNQITQTQETTKELDNTTKELDNTTKELDNTTKDKELDNTTKDKELDNTTKELDNTTKDKELDNTTKELDNTTKDKELDNTTEDTTKDKELGKNNEGQCYVEVDRENEGDISEEDYEDV